jgi:hypothetical protein
VKNICSALRQQGRLTGTEDRWNPLKTNCGILSQIPESSPIFTSKLHDKTIGRKGVVTSAQAGVATKIFYFSLTTTAFVFVLMLLLTGLHP